MDNNTNKKIGGWSLIPMLVFVVIYIVAGVVLNDFYTFPSPVALFISIVVAFIMFKGTINEKFKHFTDGCGDENIQIMLMVYLLAGAFSAVAKAMGGVDATVNFGLTFVPAQFLIAGMFVIAAFLGVATGTSMGTITALVPIACGLVDKAGLNLPLALAAVVGGAMFGDNLSMISDTTIAATRTQGVEMKDKFRVNGFIAAPAAIITIVLLVIFGKPETVVPLENLSFEFIKVVPYILVLGLAVAGLNVFVTLAVGIFSAGAIGIFGGELTVLTFAQGIYDGFRGMEEVFFLSLLVGGLSNMVARQGGIEWLLAKIRSFIKGPKSAQAGIAALAAAADLATANNTVAIIVVGSIAKSVSEEFKVDPRKTASILDIVSCIFQGAIPYGAQFLAMGSLAALSGFTVSPLDVIPFLWYQWLLAAALIVSFFVPFADRLIKKHPWNWEKGEAEK